LEAVALSTGRSFLILSISSRFPFAVAIYIIYIIRTIYLTKYFPE
jgi:hypothetical protein